MSAASFSPEPGGSWVVQGFHVIAPPWRWKYYYLITILTRHYYASLFLSRVGGWFLRKLMAELRFRRRGVPGLISSAVSPLIIRRRSLTLGIFCLPHCAQNLSFFVCSACSLLLRICSSSGALLQPQSALLARSAVNSSLASHIRCSSVI